MGGVTERTRGGNPQEGQTENNRGARIKGTGREKNTRRTRKRPPKTGREGQKMAKNRKRREGENRRT